MSIRGAIAGLTLALALPGAAIAQGRADAQTLPWYVTAGAIHRVTLKPSTQYRRLEHLSTDPATAKQQMLHWRSEGITALEIFAPEEGGNSYGGLDAKDRYRLDPGLGSIADFRRLVSLAHSLGMRVVTFQNLGYSAVDGVQFEQAEDAMRKGQTNRLTRMFFWSDSPDAPKPAGSDSYFFVRPDFPGYNPAKSEFWQWSDRAHAYYWTRWPGKDATGATIHLPQYNWHGDAWPEEAAGVIRFWMKTGLDGMILDAVNWYPGITWQKIDRDVTGPIAGYGQKFSQPEGGGGFGEDPVAWVTEGNFTNVYDYGLGIWWKPEDRPLVASVEHSSPDVLETALRAYHDRVVAAGGTLYFPVPKLDNAIDQQFAETLIAASGDLPCFCDPVGGITAPAPGIAALLKLKTKHPALYQNSLRRQIHTSNAQVYAVERYAADNSERLLLVFNFGALPVSATVDVGAIHGIGFSDVLTGTPLPVNGYQLPISLDGHGYRILKVDGYRTERQPSSH